MELRHRLRPYVAGFLHFCRFPKLIRYSGLPWLLRQVFQKKNVTILLYHHISPGTFDSHITELKKFYAIISLKEYCECRFAGKPVPERSLVITFDDGYKDLYDLLPVIKKHAVPVTMFLCTGIIATRREFWDNIPKDYNEMDDLKFVPHEQRMKHMSERYGFSETKEYGYRTALSREEIMEMTQWVDFQPHGRFHPTLPTCTAEKARDEVEGSKADLLRDYGIASYAYAYSNGDYSERDIAIISNAGFKLAVTVDGVYNTSKTDPYRIKRLPIREACGIDELIVRASGLWYFAWRSVIGQKHGLRPAMTAPGSGTAILKNQKESAV